LVSREQLKLSIEEAPYPNRDEYGKEPTFLGTGIMKEIFTDFSDHTFNRIKFVPGLLYGTSYFGL
jgi:hypothetical protein